MSERIGIIAGSGSFPFLVAQNARAMGLEVAVAGLHGNTDPALEKEAHAFTMLHLGQLSALIDFLHAHQITKVCMAGPVKKPNALDLKPDWRAAKVLFRLGQHRGDDALLRAVAAELASEGIEVVPPDVLVPALRGSSNGVLTKVPVPEAVWRDIRLGWAAAKALGGLDIGQCVVVKQGVIVAVEAIEGTDAVLLRAGELAGAGCTMVKAAKPGQDERLDLPALGANTIALASRLNFACLAFEGDKALFFDKEESLKLADEKGIAVVSIPGEAETFFARHGA